MSGFNDSEAYGKLIARCRDDANFKESLFSDPKSALAEIGVEIPAGLEVAVVQNTSEKAYLVLPAELPATSASDLQIESAGVTMFGSVCSASHSCCCHDQPLM